MVLAPLAIGETLFIANNGAATTGKSERWFTFDIDTTFAEFYGLTGEDLDEALALAEERGLPTSYKIHIGKVLLEGTGAQANGRTSDGKGIDHIETSPIVAAIDEIAAEVTA